MGRKISLMIITTILIISNIRVTANFIYTSTDKVEEHNTQYSRYANQIQKNVGKKLYTQDQLKKALQEREEKRQLNMKLHNMKVGQIRNSSRTVLQKYGNGDLYTDYSQLTLSNGDFDAFYSDDKAYLLTKEGSYFPKLGVSKMIFEHQNLKGSSPVILDATLEVSITGVKDPYNRILDVYSDGNLVLSTVLTKMQTNKISIPWVEYYEAGKVSFSLRWGGQADQAWILDYAYFDVLKGEFHTPGGNFERDVWNRGEKPTSQYFPAEYYSEIETKFVGGLYTQLDLEIERVSDTKARFISIYVDGRLKMSEEVIKGGKTQISRDLGNFNRRTVHTLTIRIRSGSASETGWRINKLEVNYEALHVEVDWMNGYRPSDWIINSIEDAYKENGYERVEFYISPSSVSTDTKVDSNDLVNYYSSDSWVKASHPDNHRYILLGARSNRDNTLGFMITGRSGSDVIFYPYAFIAVEEMKEFVWRNFIIGNDLDNNIRSVILHELGHTLTLLKTLNGDEYYNWGNTIYSVMDNPRFENTIESSFYSPFLWEGDGNWWSLRSGYTATDSIVREPISQIEVV